MYMPPLIMLLKLLVKKSSHYTSRVCNCGVANDLKTFVLWFSPISSSPPIPRTKKFGGIIRCRAIDSLSAHVFPPSIEWGPSKKTWRGILYGGRVDLLPPATWLGQWSFITALGSFAFGIFFSFNNRWSIVICRQSWPLFHRNHVGR